MNVYSALGIRKERIEPQQAWQNYIETHFNIVRKMADAKFAKATSWEEALAIHRCFVHDYNVQRHWAFEQREDGKHSPAAVLGERSTQNRCSAAFSSPPGMSGVWTNLVFCATRIGSFIWKKDDQAPAKRRRRVDDITQLPLFDLPPREMAVGAEEGSGTADPRPHLHPVSKHSVWQETEE
jgi:hypothetical protein